MFSQSSFKREDSVSNWPRMEPYKTYGSVCEIWPLFMPLWSKDTGPQLWRTKRELSFMYSWAQQHTWRWTYGTLWEKPKKGVWSTILSFRSQKENTLQPGNKAYTPLQRTKLKAVLLLQPYILQFAFHILMCSDAHISTSSSASTFSSIILRLINPSFHTSHVFIPAIYSNHHS